MSYNGLLIVSCAKPGYEAVGDLSLNLKQQKVTNIRQVELSPKKCPKLMWKQPNS